MCLGACCSSTIGVRAGCYLAETRCHCHPPRNGTLLHCANTAWAKEHIEAQRLHNDYTTMCLERRQWYDEAKHDTMRQYEDMKTSLLSYERFERLRTDTDVLLTHHTQQALYTWLQQERIIQLAQKLQKATDKNSPKLGRIQAGTTDDLPRTETTT